MGWGKYDEDIRLFKDERDNLKGLGFNPAPTINVFICQYCKEKFRSKEELEDHIRLKHNAIPLIVYINGKIIGDDNTIPECYSAEVKCFSEEGIINIDGKKIELRKNENRDIKEIINKLLSKKKTIEVSFTGGNRKYSIRKLEEKDIDNTLIKKAVMKWNSEIKDKLSLTQPSNIDNCNNDEKVLLNGIYDYYIGCKLKPIEVQDKINRYNDAISMLQNYVDISPIALFITQTIALKYNWYEYFLQYKKVSSADYYYVYNFIMNAKSNRKEKDKDNTDNVDNYIYIDDELLEIIDLIKLYQNKSDGYKNKIEEYDETKLSINGQDIVNWLKARLYLDNDDREKAKEFYDEIKNESELIKAEREEFGD